MTQRPDQTAGAKALGFRLLVGTAGAQFTFPLPLGRVVTVGTALGCDIRLDHPSLAPRHCQLEARPDAVALRDLSHEDGGPARTALGGTELHHPRLARAGDNLRFGEIEALLVGFPLSEDAGRAAALAALLQPDRWTIHVPHLAQANESAFAEVLAGELKKAPWLGISAMLHLLLLAFVWLVFSLPERVVPKAPEPLRITATVIDQAYDGLEEETEVEAIEAEAPQEPAFEALDPREPLEAPEEAIVELPTFESNDRPGARGNTDPAWGAPSLGFGGKRGRGTQDGVDRLIGDDALKGTLRTMRRNGLEVVIVFDSTGSMGGVIREAKERIDEMISVLEVLVPGVRVGLVTYRDRGRDEEYCVRACPLTQSRYRLKDFVGSVTAGGGDDIPEAVLDGLDYAFRQMQWSRNAFRFVAVIGDAPPHEQDRARIRTLVARFLREHSMPSVVSCMYTGSRAARDGATVDAFREIAALGKGVYVELDEQERVLREIIALVFGRQYEASLSDVFAHIQKERALDAQERRWIAEIDIEAMIDQGLFPERGGRIAPEVVDTLIRMGLSPVKHDEILAKLLDLLRREDLREETLWAVRHILLHITRGELDFDPEAPRARRLQEIKRLSPRRLEPRNR